MFDSNRLERQYLHAVLNWLDVCLEFEVNRWQAAGQNPADRFRGLYTSDSDALALTQRGYGSTWGSGVELSKDNENLWKKSKAASLRAISVVEEEADKNNYSLRLLSIKHKFALSDFEWKAFIVCLAPELDLRYERIYGYLQDDVTRVSASIDLILGVLLSDVPDRQYFTQFFELNAKLRQFRLIRPIEETGKHRNLLRQSFLVSEGIRNWILGYYDPAASIDESSEYIPYEPGSEPLEPFEVDGIPSNELLHSIKPIMAFSGEDLLQQELIARQLAARIERGFLKVVFDPNESKENLLEKLAISIRDARVLSAIPYLQGLDIFVDSDGNLIHKALTAILLFEDILIVSSKNPFKFDPASSNGNQLLFQVPFVNLTSHERLELWKSLLDGLPNDYDAADLEILSGQFNLSSAQIIAASSTAISYALQKSRSLQIQDLFDASRLHSGHHLSELAHKIEPRYQWDDLVLPETPITMLKEMVSMCQTRSLVLETWGLGKKLASGTGISALFSGPPGTGKTLAAQIMANQLGIDLYRIDLSTIVSKYVGETEKNLEKIFKEASESNAILFFDEADTIFGKRSEVKDAQDRYANIEVGYLLQRMESYNGVAILATNLRANLDEAFTRRLNFIINFPFPDEENRHRIWQVLMPPDLPIDQDLDLKKMASRFKLAGGNIRNIVVSAAYFAAANGRIVTMEHLLHGAKREIQKMGKLIHESDFTL